MGTWPRDQRPIARRWRRWESQRAPRSSHPPRPVWQKNRDTARLVKKRIFISRTFSGNAGNLALRRMLLSVGPFSYGADGPIAITWPADVGAIRTGPPAAPHPF